MKTSKRLWICVFFAFAIIMVSGTVQAAEKGSWVKGENGYSYVVNNVPLTGRQKIGKYYYYFDTDGIQHTGWRQMSGSYYFFRIANGKKGYMVRNGKADGIKLAKNGKAKISTARQKKKIKLLIRAAEVAEQYTSPLMNKGQKRLALYRHAVNDYVNAEVSITYNANTWDIDYASQLLFGGKGDCYAHAAGYAYLMNAIGIDNVHVQHNTVHCWVKHQSYYYDVHWEKALSINCYHRSEKASGTNGMPDWVNGAGGPVIDINIEK